jgi:hypothetical protein
MLRKLRPVHNAARMENIFIHVLIGNTKQKGQLERATGRVEENIKMDIM